ncbi:MAG: bacterioferritin [Ilumatobacteraceae bacterium]
MRGNDGIIGLLNEVLTAELTAVSQYFLHSKMMENWGYLRLAAHTKHESIDEMKHADEVTDRILFFGGTPNYQRYFPLHIGETVPEQFQADLELEYTAVERLSRGIAAATAAGDNGTGLVQAHPRRREEHHIDWLETQIETIRQIGAELYLARSSCTTDRRLPGLWGNRPVGMFRS